MDAQVQVSSDRLPCDVAPLPGSAILLSDTNDMPIGALTLTQEQRARLGSVVRLLEAAGQNLPRGDNEAYRCVAKATALLQAECELGVASPRCTKRRDFLPAWKMARVAAYIDANLDRAIRIEELAEVAKLSCSHFSRAFHSTVGEPPSSFVIHRRVERAERLILLTDKPLCQIALECGMADQSHLTKLFRRSYGMSPGRWRKLQHGSEIAVDEAKPAPVAAVVSSLRSAVADRHNCSFVSAA